MSDKLFRQFEFDTRAADPDARTVPATLSTDAPIERFDVIEVLDHSPNAVDLSRGDLPLIEGHDQSRTNIGLVEDVRLVGGKLKGLVRFGSSQRAKEMFQDVKDGIVKGLSIGYLVRKWQHDEENNTSTATRWMPFEVSAVAIPADVGAGFFRGRNDMDIDTDDKKLTRSERIEARKADQAEATRVTEIFAIAGQVKTPDAYKIAQEFVDDEKSSSAFARHLLFLNAEKPTPQHPGPVDYETQAPDPTGLGLSVKERSEFSLFKLARAEVAKTEPALARKFAREAAFELSVVDASIEKFGEAKQPGAMRLPPELVFAGAHKRDLSVGVDTAGGHTVATDLLAAKFIDTLENRSVVLAAGAETITGLKGDQAIPRKATSGSVGWVGENSAVSETNQVFDQVTLTPKTMGAFTDITRRLLLQSELPIMHTVETDLANKMAIELDRVAIEGDPDTTATANEPRGILQTAGVGSVALGTNGAAPVRDDLIDLISQVAIDNALIANPAYLMNSSTIGVFMKSLIDSGSGRFAMEMRDSAVGFTVFESNNVPSDLSKGSGSNLSAIIFGNFADMLIGFWSGVDVLIDPYTGATAGTVRILVFQDMDIAVRHVESFAAITDSIS